MILFSFKGLAALQPNLDQYLSVKKIVQKLSNMTPYEYMMSTLQARSDLVNPLRSSPENLKSLLSSLDEFEEITFYLVRHPSLDHENLFAQTLAKIISVE